MNSFGDPYGQLQFEFDGIPPLTKAEQLARAIDRGEMDLAGRCALEAALWLEDEETRIPRLQRWLHIREIEVRHSRAGTGWLIPGHAEGLWLYTEAASAYVNGEYLAVIVCSHAAAERTLAA